MQRVEVTDPLQIFVHVAVLLRSALAEGLSPPVGSPVYGCERASRVLLRAPGGHPPKPLEQNSAAALLHFCSGSRCYGHVSHGQWPLLGANMLV